jgi:hypothetical protein
MKFIILLIFLSATCQCQSWEWVFQGGGEKGIGVTTDKEGNVFAISFGEGPYGPLYLQEQKALYSVSKHDANGKILWAHSIFEAEPMALSVDGEGNLYLTGTCNDAEFYGTNSYISISDTGGGDAFLIKYSPDGGIQWAINWGTPQYSEYGNVIKSDAFGNTWVAGIKTCSLSWGSSVPDNFIRKYDTNGNLVWENTLNCKGSGNYTGIDIDWTGNCFLTGYFNDFMHFEDTILSTNGYWKTNAFVAKYANNGDLSWVRKYGSNSDFCYNLVLDSKKRNIYITGSYKSPTVFDNTILNAFPNGMFVAKLDSTGNIIWIDEKENSVGYGIGINSFDDCFVTGLFTKKAIFSASCVLNSAKPQDIFVAKYSKSGSFAWAVAPGGTNGKGNYGTSLAVDNLDNIFITGKMTDSTYFGNIRTFATVLLNSYGDQFIAKLKDTASIYTGTKELRKSGNLFHFNVYPLPAREFVKIDFNAPVNGKVSIVLSNIFGEKLQIKSCDLYEVTSLEYSLTGYSKGIYFISIQSGAVTRIKKVVID